MTKTARFLAAKERLQAARASLDYALAYPERAAAPIATLRANVEAADAECERLFGRF